MLKRTIATGFACFTLFALPLAQAADGQNLDARGDRIEQRLDNRGDRIDDRLDAKADRTETRYDEKGDRIDERLDRRSDKAAEKGKDQLADRLDRKGDRIDGRLDLPEVVCVAEFGVRRKEALERRKPEGLGRLGDFDVRRVNNTYYYSPRKK